MNALLLAAALFIFDGDTFAFGEERIRIMDIDAPERRGARCIAEREAAEHARDVLSAILNSGVVRLERHGTDKYGRTLARVKVNGTDVGQAMLKSGAAIPWRPGRAAYAQRRAHWCG